MTHSIVSSSTKDTSPRHLFIMTLVAPTQKRIAWQKAWIVRARESAIEHSRPHLGLHLALHICTEVIRGYNNNFQVLRNPCLLQTILKLYKIGDPQNWPRFHMIRKCAL